MQVWAIPLLLVVGALLAVQAGANVQLSTAMRSPLGASTLQLAIGSSLLLFAAAAVGGLGAFGRPPEVTLWHLLGGLGSAVYITAGIVLFPRLGALVTVGLFITGQMLASLTLDTLGLLGVATEPLRMTAVLGVLAVLAGAALIVRTKVAGAAMSADAARACPTPTAALGLPAVASTHPTTDAAGAASEGGLASALPEPATPPVGPGTSSAPGRRSAGRGVLLVFAVLGGAVLPIQGAINARLRLDLGAPFAVAAFSFLLATAAIGLYLSLAMRLGQGRPRITPLRAVPWWGWLAGWPARST